MANRRVLHRLLRLRELEEETSRQELELAVGERNRVASEYAAATGRRSQGRTAFAERIGDAPGRAGALIEMEQARKLQLRIEPRLATAETEVALRRERFLMQRTGRRQVETLVKREQAAAREEAARRAQQMLDDWFGRRMLRVAPGNEAGSSLPQRLPNEPPSSHQANRENDQSRK